MTIDYSCLFASWRIIIAYFVLFINLLFIKVPRLSVSPGQLIHAPFRHTEGQSCVPIWLVDDNGDDDDRTERLKINREFYDLLIAQQTASSGSGAIMCKLRATHRALIMCNVQCATWYEGTASWAIEFDRVKSHLIWLYLIGCTTNQ